MIPKGYISLRQARLICILSSDAEGRIDSEIATGTLKVYADNGQIRSELTPEEWQRIDKKRAFLFGLAEFGDPKRESDIIVNEAEFRDVCEDQINSFLQLKMPKEPVREERRGRKRYHEWDLFWAEMVLWVALGGKIPAKQDDLIIEAQTIYQRKVKKKPYPERTAVGDMIRLIYHSPTYQELKSTKKLTNKQRTSKQF
jgi:hypothetical protein